MIEQVKKTIVYSLLAVIIGAIIGVLEAGFGWGLTQVNAFRSAHLYWLLPLLAPAGLLLVFLFRRFGGEASKGMGLVFDAWQGKNRKIPKRLVPFMIGGAWITHLFGGSAGREGVAVQIGGAVAHAAGRFFNRSTDKSPKIKTQYSDAAGILMIAGMAAGFSGLFRTPITAFLFALEVLVVGELRYEAFLPTIGATVTAYLVSGALLVKKESYIVLESLELDALTCLKLVGAAIIFGLAGLLFSLSMKYGKKLFDRIFKSPYLRMAVIGSFVSVIMIITAGRYSSSGSNLIAACFGEGEVFYQDWVLKLVLTVLTLLAGFVGGEVTPLFTIGATLGFVLGELFDLPPAMMAALGVAAVFGSGTGTFFAAVAVGCELFGWEYAPVFFIVCAISKVTNPYMTIYHGQEHKHRAKALKKNESSASRRLTENETSKAVNMETDTSAEAGAKVDENK